MRRPGSHLKTFLSASETSLKRLEMVNCLQPRSRNPQSMVTHINSQTVKIEIFNYAGSTVQYDLVWSKDENLPVWDSEKHIQLEAEAEPVLVSKSKSCNTRKDRDRRQNRHTCGIFIG